MSELLPKPLPQQTIQQALNDLPGWSFIDNTITKAFFLADFREALAFLVRIGFEAEELKHHPELRNVYRSVTVSLNTHDCGGKVTGKDIALAQRIEKLAAGMPLGCD